MTAESPAPKPWIIGVADVLVLLFVFGMMQRSRDAMLDDPGLGWHIRNIDAMRAAGGWLYEDPFTLPHFPGNTVGPWRTNQWLPDILFWAAYHWGGLEGIAAVAVIVLSLTFRLLYGMLIADRIAWPIAALWTFLGAMATSISWVARPNIFSILFLLIVVRTCDLFHDGRIGWRQLLWLAPLFAVWANCHGGFIAGLITLGAATAIETAIACFHLDSDERRKSWLKVFQFGLLSALCLLATLANPYGWGLYTWIFSLLGDKFFAELHTEWLSPNFHESGAFRYELLILLLPVLLAFTSRRPNLVALGLCILWLHFALQGRRYVPLWAVAATPILARASVGIDWLNDRWRRLPISVDMRELLNGGAGPRPVIASCILCFGLLGWARWNDDFSRHNPQHVPAEILDRLLAVDRGRVVFHDYNWGGYLTWHGWPRLKNWIDDRNEAQGRQHIEEYFSILAAKPGWRDKLDRAKVALVCVTPQSPLAMHIANDKGWKSLAGDDFAVLFERVDPP